MRQACACHGEYPLWAVRVKVRTDLDHDDQIIGTRMQGTADDPVVTSAATPAYLQARGTPEHPRDLLQHACMRGQFSGGAAPLWRSEHDGEIMRIDPPGPLQVRSGAAFDLALQAALDGLGIIHLFEDWLQPHLDSGALVPVLEPWCQRFSGPFLYYSGRRQLPSPLRAFVDFVDFVREE